MTLEGQIHTNQTGDEVSFKLVIRNSGPDTVEFQFRSGQKAEFVVYANGEEIWRWSDGRMFSQALESEHLHPGEEVRYSGTWENPNPGQYQVEAELTAENISLSERAELAI